MLAETTVAPCEALSNLENPSISAEPCETAPKLENPSISAAPCETVPKPENPSIPATPCETVPKLEIPSIPIAPDNPFYEIRAIPNKGYGCVAKTAIKRGTRILADDPLLIVHIADYMKKDISEAFAKLTPEQKAQYFTLHSGHGQDPSKWPSKIHPEVTGKERQRIMEQHEARIGKEPTLISIFQINCMELGNGAAVFPHAARFNHSCSPNAFFYWNSNIGKETIHVMGNVKPGEEITISYCDMVHDARLRKWELNHYGFECDCPACGDVDDEKSYAYESTQRRFRLRELDLETRALRGERLEKGARSVDFVRRLLEMAAMHLAEGDLSERLAGVYLDIALVCEVNGDTRMAVLAAEKAREIKEGCQGTDSADYKRYVEVVERCQFRAAMALAGHR